MCSSDLYLESADRNNEVVLTPAMDLFRAFVDSATSVPEGDYLNSPMDDLEEEEEEDETDYDSFD